MHEARIETTDTGSQPAGDGWFILNLADIGWHAVRGGGTWCVFESPSARSPLLGIGVHVLQPGEPSAMYHREAEQQEGFLILSGECLLVVEGEERPMRTWDYFHCPPGTAHITVGAGSGPCAILMVGTRTQGDATEYPPDPVAARHGASVATPTSDSREAYADRPPIVPARSPWPLERGLSTTIPALPVRDVPTAAAHYRDAFGFAVRHAEDGFAVVARDAATLHLWAASDEGWRARREKPVSSGAESFLAGTASCRIEATDLDDLHAELGPVLHPASRDGIATTDFGTREFHTRDRDGNLLTFFSRADEPLRPRPQGA